VNEQAVTHWGLLGKIKNKKIKVTLTEHEGLEGK
jgi:hypothetical protein